MSRSMLTQRTSAGILEHEVVSSYRNISMVLVLFSLLHSAAVAQETSGPCAKDENQANALLHCTAELVNSEMRSHNPGALSKEPLRGYLGKLDGAIGYTGNSVDLDELKGASLALKQDAAANRDLINVLDGAIASHATEIRPAMSRETAAIGVASGTDFYPRFVEQRLNFLLDPKKIDFYKHGPFELPIHNSLANALESKYFLSKNDRDDSLLRQEIQALKNAHAMLLELPSNEQRRRARLNGNLFWQASIFFALGDKEQFSKVLHDLIYDNRDFGLENRESGHVYVYKVFDLPFTIVVEEIGADGKPVLSTDDPYILNRFYNPVQLALAACDLADSAGHGGIKAFSDVVRDLSFRDFYVIAASGNNQDTLRQFGDLLLKSIQQGDRRDMLQQEIIKKAVQFSSRIESGAAKCGVAAEIREKIYPPFDFKFEVRHIEAFGKHTEHLMLGGSLDSDQANRVAEFLNAAISADQSMRNQARSWGIESAPYTTRVRID